ncbi:unnamed protein product [Dovyalis caffra]|uniref:Late embryogenesis abundant protein n=1 Tax=Dovyalis caffra TaxID=77055 RepID=A0AAV1R3M8_9ROSI|nr:unnamed protein product [Dovyalis caffra]
MESKDKVKEVVKGPNGLMYNGIMCFDEEAKCVKEKEVKEEVVTNVEKELHTNVGEMPIMDKVRNTKFIDLDNQWWMSNIFSHILHVDVDEMPMMHKVWDIEDESGEDHFDMQETRTFNHAKE